jgi:hypothetical protein
VDVSGVARWLTVAGGVAFLLVGAVFFVAPGYSAANFPWNVSPMVAMTIGAWAIGTGAIAVDSGWRWDLARSYAALVLVWTFAVLELIVVVAFLGALRTDHLLTWPYLLALVLTAAAAVAGIVALYRARDDIRRPGERIPGWVWFFIVSFIIVVGFLAVTLFLRTADSPGQTLFPEPLTLFTVRAFSAFFASLVAGAVALLFSRNLAAPVELARVGLYLIVPIVIATLAHLGSFDFGARPGGLVYIGAYVATGLIAAFSVWWYRSRRSATAA